MSERFAGQVRSILCDAPQFLSDPTPLIGRDRELDIIREDLLYDAIRPLTVGTFGERSTCVKMWL